MSDGAAITRLWHGRDPFSAELVRLSRVGAGWELRGDVLVAFPVGGTHVRYAVRADEVWHTRQVVVELTGALDGGLTIESSGEGTWSVEGSTAPELAGCIDVDLEVSPATNTLPIRRLDPDVGSSVWTRVAWVRFPALTVEPSEQTYERSSDRRWRFRSAGFEAELEVDDDGLVMSYGDLWTTVS